MKTTFTQPFSFSIAQLGLLRGWRIAIQCLLCVAMLLVSCPVVHAESVPKLHIEPAENVDERLFLLRLLDVMYEQFPSGVQDRNDLAQAIADLRSRAKRFEQHIRRNNLGDELAGLYGDYAEVLDDYASLLAEIDRIQSGAVDRQTTSAFKSGFSSGVEGAGVYTAAKQAGVDTSDATLDALLVGGVRFLVKQYEESKAIEEDKKTAIESAQKAFETKIESAFSSLKEVAATLTSQYGWGKGETGLLMSETEARNFQETMASDNPRAITKLLADLATARPRDPFVINLRNAAILLSTDATTDTYLQAARSSERAASLVPKGGIYDEYRSASLQLAARMADCARGKEAAAGKEVDGSTEASRYAVALWNATIDFAPSDITGELRARQAWARMANGDLNQALELANEVFDLQKDQTEFCYQYACLLSRLDIDLNKPLALLKRAMQLGYYDIGHIKRDPDLANLRKERTKDFNDLVEVRFDWSINYGLFDDDILLVNKSAFALTNVRLNVIISQGEKTWSPKLTAKAILPGQTYKWENAVSIPGSRCDNATASLNCDQN